MKPHKYRRKAKGYMGEWDDGPYNKWVKKNRRRQKRSDKALAKKELEKETKRLLGKKNSCR